MTDYRKRMFRGAKIEDCVKDFIQMEESTQEQMKSDEENHHFYSGMNTAFRFVVNRMVREFDYHKGDVGVRRSLMELEEMFREKAEECLKQSKENLYEQVSTAYYQENIPKEAMEELKQMPQSNQEGMFEGMSFAYEQVANYLSIYLSTVETINQKTAQGVIEHIDKLRIVQTKTDENETETYKEAFYEGLTAGFNLAKWELDERFVNKK